MIDATFKSADDVDVKATLNPTLDQISDIRRKKWSYEAIFGLEASMDGEPEPQHLFKYFDPKCANAKDFQEGVRRLCNTIAQRKGRVRVVNNRLSNYSSLLSDFTLLSLLGCCCPP